MKSENLKILINSFHNADSFVKLEKVPVGVRIIAYTKFTISNVILPDETISACFISKSKLDYLKALLKEYKKADIPDEKILSISHLEENPREVDNLLMDSINNKSGDTIVLDFKNLEKIYKAMKKDNNNLRLDIVEGGVVAVVSNDQGDLSLLSLKGL